MLLMEKVDFSQALSEVKSGNTISREGWNGKNMFVYLVPANSYPAQTNAARTNFGDTVPYKAYLALVTAEKDVATWVPSITDLLAEDWRVNSNGI